MNELLILAKPDACHKVYTELNKQGGKVHIV